MASADESALAKLVGVYDFQHPGGTFEVHLRSQGRFFAPNFQARANWTVTEGGVMSIEWGKYGNYTMEIKDPATRYFEGHAVGKPESWRKVCVFGINHLARFLVANPRATALARRRSSRIAVAGSGAQILHCCCC